MCKDTDNAAKCKTKTDFSLTKKPSAEGFFVVSRFAPHAQMKLEKGGHQNEEAEHDGHGDGIRDDRKQTA